MKIRSGVVFVYLLKKRCKTRCFKRIFLEQKIQALTQKSVLFCPKKHAYVFWYIFCVHQKMYTFLHTILCSRGFFKFLFQVSKV